MSTLFYLWLADDLLNGLLGHELGSVDNHYGANPASELGLGGRTLSIEAGDFVVNQITNDDWK